MVLEIITGAITGLLIVHSFKKLIRTSKRKIAAIRAERDPEKELQCLQEELRKLKKEIKELEKEEAQKKE